MADQDLPPIGSTAVASTYPHAMINDQADVFYPDSPEDARWFADEHDAHPIHPDAFPWQEVLDDRALDW